MNRVCIYHVNQSHISRAAAMCGEVIATMCWECVRYEVDIETKLLTIALPKLLVFQRMNVHYYSFGFTG